MGFFECHLFFYESRFTSAELLSSCQLYIVSLVCSSLVYTDACSWELPQGEGHGRSVSMHLILSYSSPLTHTSYVSLIFHHWDYLTSSMYIECCHYFCKIFLTPFDLQICSPAWGCSGTLLQNTLHASFLCCLGCNNEKRTCVYSWGREVSGLLQWTGLHNAKHHRSRLETQTSQRWRRQ